VDDVPVLFVTGATGYLGSVLVDLLVRRSRPVRALVRDPGRAAELLPAGVELVAGDLDSDDLAKAVDGCAAVLHLAGTVGGTPEQVRHANLEGTRAILAAARKAGVPRFVQTSSSAAVMDATGLVAEEPVGPAALSDPYSASKAEADALVLAAGDLSVSIACPVSIYGPSPRGPFSYNGLFLEAARGTITTVVDAPMGWVQVADVGEGLLRVLDDGDPGKRYVLCGEVAPFGRVVNTAAELLGSPHRVRTLPPGSTLGPDAPTFARRSEVYGGFPPVHMDDAGARALGFAPRGVDEGLTLTAGWLKRYL
jgi:dihydroflavonol-4-reductase